MQRAFRVAVKVFVSGRDLCIGIIDLKFSGGRIGPWLGFSCDQPESEMFQYRFDDLLVLNKADNPHWPLAFWACHGVHLVDLLNQLGPILSIGL